MKLKDFIKSSAFKCILVLLAIALASGGILSILNDVLSVSASEQRQRVITKYYSADATAKTVKINDEQKENEFGGIEAVYLLDDGNLIINASGKNGYKNEMVKAWVIINETDGSFIGVRSVVADSSANGKQSLMGNLSKNFFDNYSENDDKLLGGAYFTHEKDDNGNIYSLASGATHTSEGMNNAVNSAVYFAKNFNAGQATFEEEENA